MIRLCIASQTPPIRPIGREPPAPGTPWRLGVDYVPQLGGVVPMMRALVRSSAGRWLAPNPLWLALGSHDLPRLIATDEGYSVETLSLEPELSAGYLPIKEAIWRSFHGPWGLGPFPAGSYRGYVEVNHRMAQQLLRHLDSYDLTYVNDFQLLLVGGLVGSAAPAILRWHIPLEFRGYPEPVRRFFLRAMEGFDAVVVSTRSALEELIRYGYQGRAFQVYPYLDPHEQAAVPESEVRKFRDAHGLGDHPYVIAVGRMDPVKRQDLVINAFAQVQRQFPDHRLVLVGGGSFSTRLARTGSAEAKDAVWDRRVRRTIQGQGLGRAIVMTGPVSNLELRAAYQGASVFVHPAPWEGFGLVAVEAWLHGLPIIVSRGAGVAELVTEGVNGLTVPPGSVKALATQMRHLLSDPGRAERMGAAGRLSARRCHVNVAARRLREIFTYVTRTYRARGRAPPEQLWV